MKKNKTYSNSEQQFFEALDRRDPKAERAIDRLLSVVMPEVVEEWKIRENKLKNSIDNN